MRNNYIKYWSVVLILFLFCNYAALCQRDQLLPIQIKENRIDSCSIIKEEQKDDSLYINILAAFTYNSKGQIVNGYHYKSTAELSFIEKYKYDDQGNVIEKIEHDLPNSTITFTLNDSTSAFQKRWIEEMRFHNRHVKYVYTYDKRNHLIKTEVFAASFDTPILTENHNTYTCYYNYNDSGCLENKIEVWPNRHKDGLFKVDSTTYVCNDQGLIIEELFKPYGESKESSYYFYNDHGKKTKEEHHYETDTNPYIFYYEYDSLMNKTSFKKYNNKGVLYTHLSYLYCDTLLIEYKYRENDGDYFEDTYYEYDSLNRKTKITNITLDGDGYRTSGIDLYNMKLSYDKSGKIKTKKKYWKGSTFKRYEGKTDYFYNDLGQVAYEKEYDEKNKLFRIRIFEYNQKSEPIKTFEFDNDSVLMNTELRYYDSIGTKYARKLIEPDGKISLYQTYKYNAAGRETGGIFFNKGRKTEIKHYDYNINGTYKTIHIIEKNWDRVEKEYLYRYEYYQ